MGMELAKHFTNHTSRLFMWLACLQTKLMHTIKHPSVHRLQTVPHIGQRATDNDRH